MQNEELNGLSADLTWHGALPHVDVWDRKPIGLFLTYAALHPLSGGGLIGIQLVGTLSTVGTVFVIWNIA